MLDAFCDVAVGGGASLVELYSYIDVWEVFFAMRFVASAPAAAAVAVCTARTCGQGGSARLASGWAVKRALSRRAFLYAPQRSSDIGNRLQRGLPPTHL